MVAYALNSFLGFILLTVSLYVMGGWLVNQDALSAIIPHFVIMVFNSALCFFIAGIGLIIPAAAPGIGNKVPNYVGTFFMVLAGLTLAQSILGINLGIDQFFVTVKMNMDAPYPGRMAPQASISFILCGLLYRIIQRRHSRSINILITLIMTLLTANFIASIVLPLMGLKILPVWHQFVRVAFSTACCFLLLSAALWLNWYHALRSRNVIRK